MHSSKIGLIFLTTLVFATPACFTIKANDDDDTSGGSSGKSGSGGTAGKGGSTSSGGSTSTGGSSTGGTTSSGGSSGTTGGSGGTTTATASCLASQLVLSYTCDQGELSAFADSTCKPYYSCSFASICSDGGLNCTDCQAYIQAYVDPSQVCFTVDQKSLLEQSCVSSLQDAKTNGTYSQCN